MPKVSLPVPHFRQSLNYTCVPAAARMALAHLGHSIDEATLATKLDTKSFGTIVRNVQRISSLGFSVSFGSSSLANVRSSLELGAPVIVFVMTGSLKYWKLDVPHAVVVVGIDDENVYLNDPWFDFAPQVSSIDDFLMAWAEFDHLAAFISK